MRPKVLTQYASHAHMIADTFRAAFATDKLGDRTIDMTAPEGSTDGGRLALQHITLRSGSGLSLVVGIVNAGSKRAELRSFSHVAKVNLERFKKAVDFDEEAYAAFVDKAESLLGAFGLDTMVTDPPVDAPVEAAPPAHAPGPIAKASSKRLLVAIAVLLVAAFAVAVWKILQHP